MPDKPPNKAKTNIALLRSSRHCTSTGRNPTSSRPISVAKRGCTAWTINHVSNPAVNVQAILTTSPFCREAVGFFGGSYSKSLRAGESELWPVDSDMHDLRVASSPQAVLTAHIVDRADY